MIPETVHAPFFIHLLFDIIHSAFFHDSCLQITFSHQVMTRVIKERKKNKTDKIWIGQRVQVEAKVFGSKWAAQTFPGRAHACNLSCYGVVQSYHETKVHKLSGKTTKKHELLSSVLLLSYYDQIMIISKLAIISSTLLC